MTFEEFQATKQLQEFDHDVGVVWNPSFTGWIYQDDLIINIDKTSRPYLEIANEVYFGTLEELEKILYDWAVDEGCFE